jgi:hypothetical protein
MYLIYLIYSTLIDITSFSIFHFDYVIIYLAFISLSKLISQSFVHFVRELNILEFLQNFEFCQIIRLIQIVVNSIIFFICIDLFFIVRYHNVNILRRFLHFLNVFLLDVLFKHFEHDISASF